MEKLLADRFDAMEDAAKAFNHWRPRIDATVDDLHLEVECFAKL